MQIEQLHYLMPGTVIINSGDQSISGDLTVDELLLGSSTDHKIAKVNHTYGDGIGLTTDPGTTTIGLLIPVTHTILIQMMFLIGLTNK